MSLLQPHRRGEVGWGEDISIPQGEGRRGQQIKPNEFDNGCVIILTKQYLWHAASPESHALPSALGWKQMFGNRGRPRSPAHGGKEALTECEAAPLCRPHRTSHLGRGGEGTQPTSLSRK